jgi:NAD(P)H-dependent FMN reductase
MTTPRILAFAGSLRTDSFNKKMVKVAAEGAKNAGALVEYIDLRDFPLPIFDEDLERAEGLPANALKLKELFKSHHGLLIACPEYNSSVTAVFKNTIDWVSRPVPGEAPLAGFAGKAAAIMSASPGQLGGIRGLVTVRMILGNIRITVLPDQLAIPKVHEAMDANGQFKDPALAQSVQKIGTSLAEFLIRHHR